MVAVILGDTIKNLVENDREERRSAKDHIVLTAGFLLKAEDCRITFGGGGEIISCSPTFLSMMSYAEPGGVRKMQLGSLIKRS